MPLTIVAQFQARPGREQLLEEHLRALVEPTRAEAGCEIYELHRSVQSTGFYHFHEVWTTRAQWEEHMQTPHLRAFRAVADDLVEHSRIFELERLV